MELRFPVTAIIRFSGATLRMPAWTSPATSASVRASAPPPATTRRRPTEAPAPSTASTPALPLAPRMKAASLASAIPCSVNFVSPAAELVIDAAATPAFMTFAHGAAAPPQSFRAAALVVACIARRNHARGPRRPGGGCRRTARPS